MYFDSVTLNENAHVDVLNNVYVFMSFHYTFLLRNYSVHN